MQDDGFKIVVAVVASAMIIGFIVFMIVKGKKSADAMTKEADGAVKKAFTDMNSITP